MMKKQHPKDPMKNHHLEESSKGIWLCQKQVPWLAQPRKQVAKVGKPRISHQSVISKL